MIKRVQSKEKLGLTFFVNFRCNPVVSSTSSRIQKCFHRPLEIIFQIKIRFRALRTRANNQGPHQGTQKHEQFMFGMFARNEPEQSYSEHLLFGVRWTLILDVKQLTFSSFLTIKRISSSTFFEWTLKKYFTQLRDFGNFWIALRNRRFIGKVRCKISDFLISASNSTVESPKSAMTA